MDAKGPFSGAFLLGRCEAKRCVGGALVAHADPLEYALGKQRVFRAQPHQDALRARYAARRNLLGEIEVDTCCVERSEDLGERVVDGGTKPAGIRRGPRVRVAAKDLRQRATLNVGVEEVEP